MLALLVVALAFFAGWTLRPAADDVARASELVARGDAPRAQERAHEALARDGEFGRDALAGFVDDERALEPSSTTCARIELRARTESGAPAMRAELCVLGWGLAPGIETPEVRARRPFAEWNALSIRRFDEQGRAWIDRPALRHADLRVIAFDEHGRLSAPLVLREDAASPCELVLRPGATLAARVLLDDGAPVDGGWVQLTGDDERCGGLAIRAATDASGVARFERLCAGRFALACDVDGRAARGTATIDGFGIRRDVTLVARSDALARAVEGRIVAASGLGAPFDDLRLAIDGEAPFPIRVRGDGSFEHWAAQGEAVELALGSRPFGPRYEPEHVRAPFGASGIVVHARPGPLARTLELVARDARTDERVRARARIALLDGDPRHASWIELDGAARVEVPRDEPFALELYAEGYRDVERRVTPAELAGANELTQTLEPGFTRAFRVTHTLDGGRREPVRDAQAWHDGRVSSRVDGEGRVVVELARWPVSLDFRARGFVEATWRPAAPGGALADRDVTLVPLH